MWARQREHEYEPYREPDVNSWENIIVDFTWEGVTLVKDWNPHLIVNLHLGSLWLSYNFTAYHMGCHLLLF